MLLSIQYLRGSAATMVVYHHARDRLPSFAEALPSPIGQAGVDLFFVISGFITTWSKGSAPSVFLMRRIIRIGPTYWLFTTLLALCIVAFPTLLKSEVTLTHYVYSVLFIPHVAPDGSIQPLLQPGWTLNYEMFFYCVFALALLVGAPMRAPCVGTALLCLTAMAWLSPSGAVVQTYTSPLMLEFAFGAFIGHAFRTGRLERIGFAAGWAMIMSGLALAILATELLLPNPLMDITDAGVRTVTYGIAASLVVIGAVAQKGQLSPTALTRCGYAVGNSSYTLYLSHLFTIAVVRLVWQRSGLGTEGLTWALAFVAVAVPVSVAVGLLTHILIEQPILRTAQKLLPERQPRRNEAAVAFVPQFPDANVHGKGHAAELLVNHRARTVHQARSEKDAA